MTEPELRLAILVHDLSATGVVRNAIRMAGYMAGRGHRTELWVIHNSGAFMAQVPAAVTIRKIGATRQMPIRRIETFLAVKSIANAIRTFRPSVLLSAGNHFHQAAGLAYARARRPPHTFFMGRASNATPRLKLPGLSAIANAFDAFKYREMHKVIAVSRELARDMTVLLGIDASRISVILNGVDIAEVQRQAAAPVEDSWFAPGSPPVIVSAGRLSRQKNFELLLDAFAHLRKQRAARLLILGDGPPRARQALLDRAARLGVADDFRLPGYEPNPMRFFARAGLFALSSRWEGASNVLLEAMACGCPVVATDCPTGVREQLDGGRIGPIVPVNDAEALTQAMARRLDEPRNSDRLRAYAAGFDHVQMLREYERLICGKTSDGPTLGLSAIEHQELET